MKQLPFSDAKKAYAILGTYSLLEHESAKTDYEIYRTNFELQTTSHTQIKMIAQCG